MGLGGWWDKAVDGIRRLVGLKKVVDLSKRVVDLIKRWNMIGW